MPEKQVYRAALVADGEAQGMRLKPLLPHFAPAGDGGRRPIGETASDTTTTTVLTQLKGAVLVGGFHPSRGNPERHLSVRVRLDQDHVSQEYVDSEVPLRLRRPGRDVVDTDLVPVRTHRRPHGPGAARHRTALAIQDRLLDVVRCRRHALVRPPAAEMLHGVVGKRDVAPVAVVGANIAERLSAQLVGVRAGDNRHVLGGGRPQAVNAAGEGRDEIIEGATAALGALGSVSRWKIPVRLGAWPSPLMA